MRARIIAQLKNIRARSNAWTAWIAAVSSSAPPPPHFAAGPVLAQETFPSHTITIINAFPPGGINDLVTRPLASVLEPILKQPVVVETKAGAAGQIGAQVAASAKPDGYTLLSHNTGISGYAEVDKLFGRPAKTTPRRFHSAGAPDRRSGPAAGQR